MKLRSELYFFYYRLKIKHLKLKRVIILRAPEFAIVFMILLLFPWLIPVFIWVVINIWSEKQKHGRRRYYEEITRYFP